MAFTQEQVQELNKATQNMALLRTVLDAVNEDAVDDKQSAVTNTRNFIKIKKNIVAQTDVFEDVNKLLKEILKTQQLRLDQLEDEETKKPPVAGAPDVVRATKKSLSSIGVNIKDWISKDTSIKAIAGMAVAGIVWIMSCDETDPNSISCQVKQASKDFARGVFQGMFGDEWEGKWNDFVEAIEIAQITILAYIGIRMGSGLLSFISGGRFPRAGRLTALAGSLGLGFLLSSGGGDPDMDDTQASAGANPLSGTVQPRSSVSGTYTPGGSNIQQLLTALAAGESQDYDTVYGYGRYASPSKPVSEMTFNELYDFQRQLIAATRGQVPGTDYGTSAVGRYQFVASTLFGRGRGPTNPATGSIFDMSGLSPTDKFSPENQERLIRTLLETQGNISGFMSGNISEDEFQTNLASIFASVKTNADDRAGTSGGMYGQGAVTGRAQLGPIFERLRTEGAGEDTMENNGRQIYLPNQYIVPTGEANTEVGALNTGNNMAMNNAMAMASDPEFQQLMSPPQGDPVQLAMQSINKINYQRIHIDDRQTRHIRAFV